MSVTKGRGRRRVGAVGPALAACLVALAMLWAAVAAAPAAAVPASPHLLAKAAHHPTLKARILAFERHARAKGIDAPAKHPAKARPDGVLRTPALRAGAITGTLDTLALLVDFSDKPHTVAATSFDSLLFGDVYGPSSVRGYYREVSYGSTTQKGLLDMTTLNTPSSVGWLRLPHTLAYYTSGGDNGTGAYPNNAQKMVEDAIAAADPSVDFSQYDNDGDGYVDNLFVVHAGQGAEYTGSSSDIWSHQWSLPSAVKVDGVWVSTYSTEPEYWATPGDMTTGVYCHEMGHVLGLPDLYDRDYTSSGVGDWSVMSGGSWNGTDGDSPARLDAWCASKLGWVQPTVVTDAPASTSIPAVASSPTGTVFKLYPDGATSGSEYWLVENRQKTGTDAALPGAGLLIWHVDESRDLPDSGYQNDTESHKLVDLEEAGTQWLDEGYQSGSPSDPFPGSTGNTAFTDSSTPNARTYAGAASRVAVYQISASGPTMTAQLGVIPAGTSVDTTPPVVTCTGATDDWYFKVDTVVTLTATDETDGSGVESITYQLDDQTPVTDTDTASFPVEVTIPAEPNGVHTLTYHATDVAGNSSAAAVFTATTDTGGPVGHGRAVSGRKGRAVRLRYLFTDAYSPNVWRVSVLVKNSHGRKVYSKALGYSTTKAVGSWYSFGWTPKARGRYRYWVTCRDYAGNAQAVRASARVTVR